MLNFSNKVLFIGFGSVAQCTLPLLVKHINIPPTRITVLDFEDQRDILGDWLEQGVRFVQARITPENLGAILAQQVCTGDVLIDLGWNIDAVEILQWCHTHGVLYINTSVEVWDPYTDAMSKHPVDNTLYIRHLAVQKLQASWASKGTTAVLEHGANPGLVSHWTKQALLDISERLLVEKRVDAQTAEQLQTFIKNNTFNQLARTLGVKVIHCSERDTQISDKPKQVGEFVNTWSIEGFFEEGATTAELGWGTHEKELPAFAYQHAQGRKNQICLARMGMNVWVRSWVPNYPIHGMVIRHGEAFTLSDYLSVEEQGEVVYRPTVHYAYCPCDNALASLQELRAHDYQLQAQKRIMNDEITAGEDILGAFLMGHAYKGWWTGSRLTIERSRQLVPHQSATTTQVAIAVVAAVMWMIENPEEGICTPEELPHTYILNIARPYLGDNLSMPVDWTPRQQYQSAFQGYNAPQMDTEDPWQFKNFLVADGD
ncbi:homospermidine synthase [Beggiatoa alba B18LD]|uniref:Homospermidine synthase n=1 Tax=Beggiatoa alba B18LD TaxID=395493 RepID=I3CH25_9GAMM|nr:saccharopine dehydrogenase C-terminal domain-containing protein [Beggiatoa alba]EIJ42918.1 homospermidine synthase [Beggiatoa alba B18LD]